MECRFLKRNGYNDYECHASHRSVDYDWYNEICTTTRFVDECSDYRRYCHVSTMIFDMIGKCDNCDERSLISKLRLYASQNPDLDFMLNIYDIVGPQIASAIKDMNDCCEIYCLYKEKISPICENVKNNCYDLALVKYFRFIKSLIRKYNNSIDLTNCFINDENKNFYIRFRKSIRNI